jgi:2-polyprenyl-3-methyl-5-hydroxy-6-metoxy-1,4-benzoquinol methylase
MHTALASDAVTYHASLAMDWDRRYQKRSFQTRERVLARCLQGHDLIGRSWLDAGCGTGRLSRCLASRGCRVLGVDAASEMISTATQLANSCAYFQRLQFARVETIARLPMVASSVDGILCSSVLEYVADPHACLAEFSRVLKPGGMLLVSVPNRNSIVRRIQLGCHRLGLFMRTRWAEFLRYSRHQYSMAEFEQLLAYAGFSVSQVAPFGSPLPSLAQRSRIWASLLLFVARKV